MKMKDKVRRKHVNWFKIMVDLKNPDIEHQFIILQSRLIRGKCLSLKRCAYYALKKYYSTTTIDELLSKIEKKGVIVHG